MPVPYWLEHPFACPPTVSSVAPRVLPASALVCPTTFGTITELRVDTVSETRVPRFTCRPGGGVWLSTVPVGSVLAFECSVGTSPWLVSFVEASEYCSPTTVGTATFGTPPLLTTSETCAPLCNRAPAFGSVDTTSFFATVVDVR
jgi:hypothetical protein